METYIHSTEEASRTKTPPLKAPLQKANKPQVKKGVCPQCQSARTCLAHRPTTPVASFEVAGVTVNVVRARVKNANLRIRPDGSVHMSVPLRTSLEEARRVAERHAQWIQRNSQAVVQRSNARMRTWTTGEKIFLWGNTIPLTVSETPDAPRSGLARVIASQEVEPPASGSTSHQNPAEAIAASSTAPQKRMELLVPEGMDPQERARLCSELVLRLYADEVKKALQSLLPSCQNEVGVRSAGISIRYMRTRWGSCTTSTRRIRLSSALASYSPRCLRAVLVHELCHIIQPNHSPAFWALMDQHCPSWRECRAELRDRGPLELPQGA